MDQIWIAVKTSGLLKTHGDKDGEKMVTSDLSEQIKMMKEYVEF
jgi:hypothetical protein